MCYYEYYIVDRVVSIVQGYQTQGPVLELVPRHSINVLKYVDYRMIARSNLWEHAGYFRNFGKDLAISGISTKLMAMRGVFPIIND